MWEISETMMELHEKLYTADEFFEFLSLPENDDRRFELDNGRIVEIQYATPFASITGGRIAYFLNSFVLPRDLGYVAGANGAFILSENRVRLPNGTFISKIRMPKIPERLEIAPDLAVEVVSPDEDIFMKANEYLRAGTKIVWAVYTDELRVYALRLDEDGALRSVSYGIDATLDGGDVLPGFSLPVRDIFPT
jgi:Uma2 family endonuclease